MRELKCTTISRSLGNRWKSRNGNSCNTDTRWHHRSPLVLDYSCIVMWRHLFRHPTVRDVEYRRLAIFCIMIVLTNNISPRAESLHKRILVFCHVHEAFKVFLNPLVSESDKCSGADPPGLNRNTQFSCAPNLLRLSVNLKFHHIEVH